MFSRFRKRQDRNAPGLSISARNARWTRNLVSMRFNMINWLLETVSTSLVLVGENKFFTILYLLVNSCGTPLVYYLGIENNRREAREHFQSHVRIFKRRKDAPEKLKSTKEVLKKNPKSVQVSKCPSVQTCSGINSV